MNRIVQYNWAEKNILFIDTMLRYNNLQNIRKIQCESAYIQPSKDLFGTLIQAL